MPDFIEAKTIYVIFHLLGVVIGMGGAFMSDAIFFSSIHDSKISHTEMRFIRLGGRMVWIGLAIIVVSGLLLFSLNTERYLASGKFLAKMTVVAVIIANGAIFHLVHIPRLHRHAGQHFPSSDEFMRKAPLLIASGAVSVVSWTSALILGVFRSVPYSYFTIMGVYVVLVALAVTIALALKRKIVPHLL